MEFVLKLTPATAPSVAVPRCPPRAYTGVWCNCSCSCSCGSRTTGNEAGGASFKYILDFSSLDFAGLSDDRHTSLRDLAIMQNFPRLLRSYGLSRHSFPFFFSFSLFAFYLHLSFFYFLHYAGYGQSRRLCFTSPRAALLTSSFNVACLHFS